jgi:hypothetical protein
VWLGGLSFLSHRQFLESVEVTSVAPRRPPQRRGSQSPNTVLVIFLIFFVLATLLAGVLAYYGYDGQKKLKEEAAKAKNDAKAAQKAQEWSDFQSYLARKALGVPLAKGEGIDEETQWQADLQEFDADGKVTGAKFGSEKNKATIEELFKKAKDDLGWDGKGFKTNYRAVLKTLADERDKAKGEAASAIAAKDALKNQIQKESAKRKKFYADMETLLKEQGEKALEAALKKTEQIGELLKKNTELTTKLRDTETAYRAELNKEKQRAFRLEQKYNALKKEQGEGVIAPAGAAPGKANVVHALLLDVSQGKPLWDRPIAKVTRISAESGKVYIDKGSADGVKTGLSFLVFAAGAKNKAEGPLKGTITVEEVIGDHSAAARVTSIYDLSGSEVPQYDYSRTTRPRQNENPIREGDLLFNLTFGAHVAVAGAPHWSGVATPSAQQLSSELRRFLAVLREEGVTVDAYVDLSDGHIEGAITPRTRFLIRGVLPGSVAALPEVTADQVAKQIEGQAGPPAGKVAGKGEDAVAAAVRDGAKTLAVQAIAQGAFVISADNYLTVIGYRPPRSADEAQLSRFRPGLPTAGAGEIGQALQGGGQEKQQEK